ncbi:MAG: diguanylate cyclase [Gammaproteobacteria bacterium]|nr:diguanylate cyclase [Gammaproteobacteria bacterium]
MVNKTYDLSSKEQTVLPVDDITLTRMSRDELEKELELYRSRKLQLTAIDHLKNIGSYEWCYDSNQLISCSKEYASIYNRSPEQMLEAESSFENSLLGVHPDDREFYRQKTEDLSNADPLELEYRIIQNGGGTRHVRETFAVNTDDKTGCTHVYGILQDISELKDHRKALEYREALAQQAELITDIGHFIFNEIPGTYSYVSPGYARIFGFTPEQYKVRIQSHSDDYDDIYSEDHAHVKQIYDRYTKDGEAFSVEYRIRHANGELRWVRERCTAHSIRDGEIIESLGVLQDITHQKNIESELLKNQSSLEATVEKRTLELGKMVKLLEVSRNSLETTVESRTQELATIVAQLKNEIKEREKVEAELHFLANHDALTGLPSLRLCLDRLDMAIAEAKRNNQNLYVMFIDLDGFKQINDSYGHDYGDIVLKESANRIRTEVRETDTAARIGGDEFMVILTGVTELKIIEQIASKLNTHISQDIIIEQTTLNIRASIGISVYPLDGMTAEELIKQADAAMYKVKKKGKNDFGFISSKKQTKRNISL